MQVLWLILYDVNSMAQNMHEILINHDLKAVLNKKGLERAKTFTWDNAANKTINVYKLL